MKVVPWAVLIWITHIYIPTNSKDRSTPQRGWGVWTTKNAWAGYAIRSEGHLLKNLLGSYARWKGSFEKLANVDGRRWKDTLGRKRCLRHTAVSLPYQKRTGHRLARDQEALTWRIWMDNVREDLKEKNYQNKQINIQKLPGLVMRPKIKRKSGGVLWELHRRHSWRKRRQRKIYQTLHWFTHFIQRNSSKHNSRHKTYNVTNYANQTSSEVTNWKKRYGDSTIARRTNARRQ